ncbi:thioredoxin domain-containing protein [Nocardia cyriacigeorgica]|uniref:Thioredoxin domain-containing protein n=1 Tax=Nocardia cyriacigeorgica TaxID=135487 RepID=A0A6P1CL59_9NOCA|nr:MULTISPECIES: thioredoxin domain-containing protein [Nocardia]MBF6499417.1 thioredoxin domain-containing protein [Nocardia cyriacigeorgica]NEW33341.1 thioredoxin domain-containing protein [Nocardia cyriacigeorgica]
MTSPVRSRRKLRILTTIAAVFVVVVAAVLVTAARDNEGARSSGESSSAAPVSAVRPDSHRLSTAADGRVTLVEFLDFECEACRAAYPLVERLREEYGDRVSFVVRYFPIPSHFNAERAARSVEAAAQQGRFEQMYQRMYETQAGWGEQRVPADEVFRGFAADLGLDLAAYDAAYNDPATLDRVRSDFNDGIALGVQGTPTFFVNDEMVTANSYEDLAEALDSALG